MTKNNNLSESLVANKAKVLPILFFFSMMFSISIGGISLRYPMLIVWLVFLVFAQKRFVWNSRTQIVLISLISLMLYAGLIMFANKTENTFELLRFARCIVSYLAILLFFSSQKYSREECLRSLIFVLAMHTITIILGVLFPPIKEIVYPISQYNKASLRFRSTGLLSGYDDAGLLCNTGIILRYSMNKAEKNRGIDLLTILFILGSMLTSRMNMLCTAVILLIILIVESKNKHSIGRNILVGLLAILGGAFAFIFWILTTNVNPELKSQLLLNYPVLKSVYSGLLSSYVDYGVYTNALSRHYRPEDIDLFQAVFGKGIRSTLTDIGYVKSMYSYGVLGIGFEIFIYYITCLYISKDINARNDVRINAYYMIVVLFLIMEAKTAVLYSSTTFELITIIYMSFVIATNNKFSSHISHSEESGLGE